jgi:hypothetical protein
MAHPTIEVREVSGLDEANVGDTVEYKVTRYNRAQDKVSESERQFVQWAVKVDGVQEILQEKTGETLNLDILKEWNGKEIVVMAARSMWKFDEKMGQKTRIGEVEKRITKLYWLDADTNEEIAPTSSYKKVKLYFETQGYREGEIVEAKVRRSDDEQFEDNSFELVFTGIVDQNGKATSKKIYEDNNNQ